MESGRVGEPRRTALPHGSPSRGFMVMGLVSGWSLAVLIQSLSWWRTARVDASERDSGKWTDTWYLSSFDLS